MTLPEEVLEYQDGTINAYQEALTKNQQEIMLIEMNLALSDDNSSLVSHPGWVKLIDRLKTLRSDAFDKLRRKTDDYPQGRIHGNLDVLDAILNTAPMNGAEIDSCREQLTVLRRTEAEYQEILR